MTASGHPSIWFEVEDFLEHFDRASRPTGIQRVQMEMLAIAHDLRSPGAEIRFCRLNRFTQRFQEIGFDQVRAAFQQPPLAHAAPHLVPGRPRLAAWLANEREKFRTTRHHFLLRLRERIPWLRGPKWWLAPMARAPFRPGDLLVCLGTAWWNMRYGDVIARAIRSTGVKFAALVYDAIPVTHPEWMTLEAREVFRHWIRGVLANAGLVLTISEYSRAALLEHARREGLRAPGIEVLPLGAGFRVIEDGIPRSPELARLPERFALFVSTLEPRKNHRLLLRVWRHLIDRHGAAAVPELVLVGRRGWMVGDLMAELEASAYLGGKVMVLGDLTDAELREVYRRSLVGVYPSLAEGWGLPVAECLEAGKLCVASNRAAIPEVGGDLVDYFDPEDERAATATLERALFDEGHRRAREARIRAEYRPPGWSDCVTDLMIHLDGLRAGAAAVRATECAGGRERWQVHGRSP